MCTAESFGKTHDFALYKNSIGSRVLDSIKAQADSGYQGITAIHHNSETPKKKPRGGTLTNEEKKREPPYFTGAYFDRKHQCQNQSL